MEQKSFQTFEVPKESEWAILLAHLATLGEQKKIEKIHEYLFLKSERDEGRDYDRGRFERLQRMVSKQYFVFTDAAKFLETPYSETDAGQDLKERYDALLSYLEQFEDKETAPDALREAMGRMMDTNRRGEKEARDLAETLAQGTKYWDWDPEDEKNLGADYIERNFPDFAQESLHHTAGILNSSLAMGREIKRPRSALGKEYIESMRRVLHFMKSFNEREDLNFVDLMYDIPTHRGATAHRGSTDGMYAPFEALIEGLAHKMPSQEKQREQIDLIHHCIDPDFLTLSYAYKLSHLNTKHELGLNTHDIDLFGTMTGMVSSVMRGYGIDKIDDRVKQYLHNTADHSLRVCITVAGLRDASIGRFRRLHQDGVLSDEQLETQIKFAYETATYMSKVACLHDVGEFLGELLGNNMKGKLDREEDIYRTLRNPVEDHVADVVVMREVSKQLKTGPLKGRWLKMDVNGYLDATLHRPGGFDFNTSFYSTCFKATERQQTNKEIVDNNEVGRINQEGYYESSPTLALDDVRFTMQYIYSKITGHKFKTTDPLEIAQFHDALYWQKREKDDFLRANRVAQDTGVALPHNPDVTRLKDLDHTSLPLDVYMDERDIDYENSLFKKFVDQTLKNYKTLPLEVARARQMHDEALLYAQCYEMNHYTKRHARVCGLDPSKVDKAVRKSIGQGVTMAQADLAKRGLAEVGYKIGLEHLEVPDEILGMQRYRWGSFNTTDTLLGDPEKPEQHFEPLQAATENIGLVFKAAHNGFLKPFMDLVRTPAQLMLLVANENISDKDIRRLYEVTAANELGGDLGIAAQGAAQSGVEGLDDKVFALANPVLTMLLASPQRQAEAVEKCYGHVLNLYSHQIAKKYGIEDVMPLLRKREYLKKGPYHKRPTDMKLSGIMSEDMYRYYSARYKGREDGPPIHAEYERAERYVLHEIIISEVGKLAGRLAQETNPAQKLVLGERLEKLRAANDRIATDMFFHTAGKHYSELRFGMIGTLGLMFAGSGVGSTFGIPFTDMHMTTSAVYGLNLALAGFSACAASLAERQRQLSCNNILRRIFTNLPHFEKGPKGGLYIVKGARHKPSKRAYEDFDYARKALIKEPQKSGPNFLVQFGDTLIAIPVTAVRALSNRATSSMAFANQGTAQLVDTGGVLVANGTKLVQGVAGPADALQAAASLLSTHSFNWTTAMNMHMHEMSENIAKGKDFDPESARQKNRDLIRAGGNEAIMNAMSNIARKTRGTPIGWLGRQMNRVAFNRVISDLTHSVLDRRERKRLAQAAAAASQPDQSYD